MKLRPAAIAACGILLFGSLGAAVTLRRWLPERCPAPGDADNERLAAFVRIKYKLPPGAKIGVADGGLERNSCFRKMVFATISGAPFRTELFLSPDLRFLTSELLDARPDPKAEAAARRSTAASLLRGAPPARGAANSPATVAVFSDFECPFCARAAKVLSGLSASQPDRLRIVYRYFPLPSHPWARQAAEAAACAQRQSDEAFWALHDYLFSHQNEVSPDNLRERITQWADSAKINRAQFETCVSRSLTSGQVEQDLALGKELGVRATPTIFLNGELLDQISPEDLTAAIRQAQAGR